MTDAGRRRALQELCRVQLAAFADGFTELAAEQLKELSLEFTGNATSERKGALQEYYIGSESEATDLASEAEQLKAVQKESTRDMDYNIQKESTLDETLVATDWADGLPTSRAQGGARGQPYPMAAARAARAVMFFQAQRRVTRLAVVRLARLDRAARVGDL